MISLVRAEFLKLRTTQVWFWMLLAAVAVTVLLVIAQVASAPSLGDAGPSDEALDVYGVFTSSGSAYIVVFVLGVLGVTTEFRYQTITPTVLTTPSRWTLITAKLITFALVGIAYAVICVVAQVAVALPWISAKGYSVSLGDGHVQRALLGVFAVVALFGIVGLGVGALLRNQIVAVTVGVIFLLVLNNVLPAIPVVKNVFPYTPLGGVASILTITGPRDANGVELFSGIGGVVVLLLWAFVPAILGASLSMNRDIT